MNPKISIIVPCYNQAAYLSETLQSVLDQEYADWECIIVNDGSPDNTEEIAMQWFEKDSRFKYFYKTNSGVSDTRNFGIQQATGEYILPLDSDDKIESHYISKALKVFEKNTDTKLVYSNSILFGKKDEKIIAHEFNFERLLFENYIFCSAIFRKADFLKTSGYNPNMKHGLEDWDFWLTFLKKEDVVVKLDDFHFFYRIKDISRSQAIDIKKNESLLLQIFKNHTELYLSYVNPIRNYIEANYYKEQEQVYKRSIEYKIGYIICTPIRIIKKILKQIF
ncbi:glycosyltransferase family A protein [Dysgonomonas sp. ZJ709]|uniref:glycosyltransferase family 2 protein n=1 Tax=Dysgonomonas sp. ZJ709 TaxID=2709797 RepID=UPI0013EC247B|nr:glycosyltransferase family A protein [Dysgonomonas sp. ZJ709]